MSYRVVNNNVSGTPFGIMMSNLDSKGASMSTIIVALFVFFPVGVFMMLSKLKKEKTRYFVNGKRTCNLGWFFIGLAVLYILLGLTGGLEASDGSDATDALIIVSLVCCAIGGAFILHGKKYMKKGKKFLKYVDIIGNSQNGSLDSIAAAYPCTYDEACSDLRVMLSIGMFPGCQMDLNRRIFVSPFLNTAVNNNVNNEVSSENYTQPSEKTVMCPSCGAMNKVSSSTSECEYCGNILGI